MEETKGNFKGVLLIQTSLFLTREEIFSQIDYDLEEFVKQQCNFVLLVMGKILKVVQLKWELELSRHHMV